MTWTRENNDPFLGDGKTLRNRGKSELDRWDKRARNVLEGKILELVIQLSKINILSMH